MKLKYDLHTHTVFSHGKGTIEDNVKAGIVAGLEMIGISDHGPGHVTYGVKRSDFPVMRREIDRLQVIYPQIKIILGVEGNIIDRTGKLDLTLDEERQFDYINAGYHYGVFGREPFFAARVHLGNLLWEGFAPLNKKKGAKCNLNRNINTELIIKAIYNNSIKVLTHPGAKAAVDLKEIAKACADRGTLLEINDGHGFLTSEGIRETAAVDVEYIIGSDAHTPERVGRFEGALENALEAGLDLSRIVNLEV